MTKDKLSLCLDLLTEKCIHLLPPQFENNLTERQLVAIGAIMKWLPWRPWVRVYERPESVRTLSKDGNWYAATRHLQIRNILSVLKTDDIFMDLGCGDGRVLRFIAARRRLASVVGVELVPELARVAEAKASMSKFLTPIVVVMGDAAQADLSKGTFYYLCNPFGSETLSRVLKNIGSSLQNIPRKIRIVYLRPEWGSIVDSIPWLLSDRDAEEKLNRNLSGDYIMRAWHN